MAFNWSDYVELADWLTKNQSTAQLPVSAEAARRSAVSRAYYAAFQRAMALLVAKNEFTPAGSGTDHGAVLQVFRSHPAQPRRQIAIWLDRLRDRRRKADYSSDAEIPAEMAQTAVADARRIITYLAAQ